MREAPSLTLIDSLLKASVTVRAYDPAAMNEARKYLNNEFIMLPIYYDAVQGLTPSLSY